MEQLALLQHLKMKERTIEENSIDYIISASFNDFPKIYNHFKSKSSLSALDLGCRVPINLFSLYHLFDFTTLIGVDLKSEEDCAHLFIEKHNNSNTNKSISGSSFYDIYNQIYKSEEHEKPKILTKPDFDKIFLKDFVQQDVKTFLESTNQKFDIIIASNILHFFPSSELIWFIDKIKSLLTEDGIVYIRIQTGICFSDNSYIKKIIREYFDVGEITDVFFDGKWYRTNFINFEYQ